MNIDKNILAILLILVQCLFIFINQFIYAIETLGKIKSVLLFVDLIILTLTVSVLYVIRGLGDEIRKKTEINFLKLHLDQVEKLILTLQMQQHEHTRHIQTLQAMLYLDEISSAKQYIDGISEKYKNDRNDIIVIKNNPALTALLNSKIKVAESKRINFDFAIKCDLGKLKISSWDLCSILGNLIDNAFEAVLEEKNNRKVGLEIKFDNNEHVIYVYNNGPKIIEKEKIFTAGYSTKKSIGRGFGLYIVSNIVKKYNGWIEVISDKRTVFIVHLPFKSGDKVD